MDTNVVVSGLNFPGNERLVVELALRGRFELYLSSFILEEVAGVLGRKFGWDEDRVTEARRTLEKAASVIEPQRFPDVIEADEADNRILECTIEASVDFLITGDRRHLLPLDKHQDVRILNAPQFLSVRGPV